MYVPSEILLQNEIQSLMHVELHVRKASAQLWCVGEYAWNICCDLPYDTGHGSGNSLLV